MGKGIPPKVNETQGFLTLGHSNWTICSLIFVPKFSYLLDTFTLLPQRDEERKEQGQKMRKETLQ